MILKSNIVDYESFIELMDFFQVQIAQTRTRKVNRQQRRENLMDVALLAHARN